MQMGSSRQRYRSFVQEYKEAHSDDKVGSFRHEPQPENSVGSMSAGVARAGRSPVRKYIREYLRVLRPYRVALCSLLAIASMSTVLQMLDPLFVRFIVDRVLLNTQSDSATKVTRLDLVACLFLVVTASYVLSGTLRDYAQRLLNGRLMLAFRRSLFGRLLHLPLSTLSDMKTGGILSRLTGDVDTTGSLVQVAIVSPFLAALRLTVVAIISVTLNWRLAVAVLATIPGLTMISFFFADRIRPIYLSIRSDAQQIDGRVGEVFSGIRIVRTFRREALELLEYIRGRQLIFRKEMFAQRRELVLWVCWNLLIGVVNVVIVWYGGHLFLEGRATIGDILAFQWYTLLLLSPVWNVVNSFSELQRSLAALERVFGLLSMKEDKPDRLDARDTPHFVGEIQFENVWFEYRNGQPIIRNLNVLVPGGSLVALVGRSGAGKTTVTDLVARFHDPTSGRILLNGTDIRDYSPQAYRRMVGIVQQDVFLFDGSVRDNIAYGRHDASDGEVEEAARRANAHDFIMQLPNCYQTFIGERGFKLSGGQQQRLAIARAIVSRPQIIILDEATSNLDTESEQLIQASMASLLKGRTTFVVAHRLSTVRRAHLILLLENGCAIERGTHEELMASRGIYYAMVARQADRSGLQR
jgi:ATP-binding cassette, subfamily B, bacterial